MALEPVQIVIGRPPNYDEIKAKFNLVPGVVFAYAPSIYNPDAVVLQLHITEHEKFHISRQGSDPAAWWRRYIDDESFRLYEEVLAHQVEIEAYVVTHQENRNPRDYWEKVCAQRLCSKVYGRMIGYHGALDLLTKSEL
jgi:hypothetical protein